MADDLSNFKFHTFIHFSQTPVSETVSTNGHRENPYGAIFGSSMDETNDQLKWSFQGIIHSAYLIENDQSWTYIRDNILTPRSGQTVL